VLVTSGCYSRRSLLDRRQMIVSALKKEPDIPDSSVKAK
jgi:hypothetical protein